MLLECGHTSVARWLCLRQSPDGDSEMLWDPKRMAEGAPGRAAPCGDRTPRQLRPPTGSGLIVNQVAEGLHSSEWSKGAVRPFPSEHSAKWVLNVPVSTVLGILWVFCNCGRWRQGAAACELKMDFAAAPAAGRRKRCNLFMSNQINRIFIFIIIH